MLLGFLLAGCIGVLLPTAFVARQLGGRGWWPVVKAVLFGIPVALCRCGVLPVAAALRRSGAGRSATISFLISSPETGMDSLLVTWGILGWPFALFRLAVALVNGVIGGLAVALFGGPEPVAEAVRPPDAADPAEPEPGPGSSACCHSCGHCATTVPAVPRPRRSLGRVVQEALQFGFVALPQDLAGPLLLGLAAAAVLTLGSSWLLPLLHGVNHTLGIALAMLLGLPMYVCSTASVPIAASLVFNVGLSPGAALAFLIAGPATNTACLTTLWRMFGPRTMLVYLASVAGTAFGAGLLLDRVFSLPGHAPCGWCSLPLPAWLLHTAGITLLAILAWPLLQRAAHGLKPRPGSAPGACNHCGGVRGACNCASAP
jgi:uncharacterized membrane protein YraQ (UPF0718 family)